MERKGTSKTIDFYNRNAASLFNQYQTLTTEQVHGAWLSDYAPSKGVVLDVGAGSGRDANYFAGKGLDVIAVEPSTGLGDLAKSLTGNGSVKWLNDHLPDMTSVIGLQLKYDLILVSAVWMHIPPTDRPRAFRKLANLLKAGGTLVISLRHGQPDSERPMFDVSAEELERLARQQGLAIERVIDASDELNRSDVQWQTVVLRLPDDGTGAFPLLRSILINDSKSSTYKLALLRSLMRIADGNPGAVLERSEGRVTLPLGLVSLYWARQYKLLLDANIQQSSNPNKGLGFVTDRGWERLSHFSNLDFAVGNTFHGDDATALHTTLKDISRTIQKMPARYITFPGSDRVIFEVEIPRSTYKPDNIQLDLETLTRYGRISVPENIWDMMARYSCWIEPALINEWVNVMRDYKNNTALMKHELIKHLEWQDAVRTTQLVRAKIQELNRTTNVRCIWSGSRLTEKYDVDHCLPFARWPNNDLWNLLPTKTSINASKRDRIPTEARLRDSKNRILNWWGEAWEGENSERFYTEATLSLPGLNHSKHSIDDVYEALTMQSMRLAEFQSIERW